MLPKEGSILPMWKGDFKQQALIKNKKNQLFYNFVNSEVSANYGTKSIKTFLLG